MSVDKNILDTLTDEERAAIAEPDHTQEELDAMAEIAGGKGNEADEDEGDEGDEDGDGDGETGEAAPLVEGKGTANTLAETPDGAETPDDGDKKGSGEAGFAAPDDDVTEALPRYTAKLPEDYDAQLKAVDNDLVALNESLGNGNIEFAEFQAELATINAKRDELAAIKLKADISAEMNEQAANQEWAATVQRFIRNTKRDEQIDYMSDKKKHQDLDVFVRVLASDPENNDKSLVWFMEEAHSMVKAKHGIGRVTATVTDVNDGKPAIRRPPLAAVPKNLSQVPGGSGPGDVSDEYSNLDGLDGLELEDAIAKLSPAQRERWLKAA